MCTVGIDISPGHPSVSDLLLPSAGRSEDKSYLNTSAIIDTNEINEPKATETSKWIVVVFESLRPTSVEGVVTLSAFGLVAVSIDAGIIRHCNVNGDVYCSKVEQLINIIQVND